MQSLLHLLRESRECKYISLFGSRWVIHRIMKDSLMRSRSSIAAISTTYEAHLSLPVCTVGRCCLGMPFLHLLFYLICMSKKKKKSNFLHEKGRKGCKLFLFSSSLALVERIVSASSSFEVCSFFKTCLCFCLQLC